MHAKVATGKRLFTGATRRWMTVLGIMSLVCAVPLWAEPDATAPPEETALSQLFEGVSPAVVSVVARRLPRQGTSLGQESRGSGFFIDREGHLLTNAHFLNNATQIAVIPDNGQELPARVAGLAPASQHD